MVRFGGVKKKDYSRLGSILGSPSFGRLQVGFMVYGFSANCTPKSTLFRRFTQDGLVLVFGVSKRAEYRGSGGLGLRESWGSRGSAGRATEASSPQLAV